jgi:hypothetical protein
MDFFNDIGYALNCRNIIPIITCYLSRYMSYIVSFLCILMVMVLVAIGLIPLYTDDTIIVTVNNPITTTITTTTTTATTATTPPAIENRISCQFYQCKNGGESIKNGNSCFCKCNIGYYGKYCEKCERIYFYF